MNENKSQFKPLTHEKINDMLAAIRRINAIHTQAIKQQSDQAELESATTYLAQSFLQHAGEFLGTWITVANEYEPLVAAWASFNSRTAGYAAQKQAAAVKAAQPITEAADGKIVIPNFVQTNQSNVPRDQAPTV